MKKQHVIALKSYQREHVIIELPCGSEYVALRVSIDLPNVDWLIEVPVGDAWEEYCRVPITTGYE